MGWGIVHRRIGRGLHYAATWIANSCDNASLPTILDNSRVVGINGKVDRMDVEACFREFTSAVGSKPHTPQMSPSSLRIYPAHFL